MLPLPSDGHVTIIIEQEIRKKKGNCGISIYKIRFLVEDKYTVDVGDLLQILTLHVVDLNVKILDSD